MILLAWQQVSNTEPKKCHLPADRRLSLETKDFIVLLTERLICFILPKKHSIAVNLKNGLKMSHDIIKKTKPQGRLIWYYWCLLRQFEHPKMEMY